MMNRRLLVSRYITFDLIASVFVWILFMAFRKTVNDAQFVSDVHIFVPNFDFFTSLILFPISCVFVHFLSGYYVNPLKESKFTEFFSTLVASFIISIVIFFVLMIDDIVVSYVYYYYSLLVLFGLLFIFTYFFRVVVSAGIRRAFKAKKMSVNTLIIGTGANAKKMAADIISKSKYNTLVGFIQADNSEQLIPENENIGAMIDVENIIEKYHIKEVVIALDNTNEEKVFRIINHLFNYDVDIQFSPRLYEILTGSRVHINKFGITPLVNITKPSMNDWELSLKRFFDILLSSIALILLTPVLIYFAAAIKRDSKGSILYRQERVGYHGKRFYIYKLRTMRANSEKGNPKLSSPDDNRITRVGRTLRKYRLDEIPQFWNIIKGDMSLVGPRPERQFFIDKIIKEAPYYCLLYKIRPGLTSWGPIKIGYSDTVEKMIERLNYDIVYMENMSLINDIKIIFFTFEIIFTGKGV